MPSAPPSSSDPSMPPEPGPHPTRPEVPTPGTDLAADLGAGLSFAGSSMLRNPLAFLPSGAIHSFLILVFLIGSWIAAGLVASIRGAGVEDYWDEPPPGEVFLALAIVVGVTMLSLPIAALWASGVARAAEVIRTGGRPTFGQTMFGAGRVVLTAFLVGAIALLGILLCVVPGLAASVLLFYAIPASARGATPVAALRESIRLARDNLGTTIVGALVVGVIAYVAAWLVITMLISIPLYILFQVGLYERLNGRTLPQPARA